MSLERILVTGANGQVGTELMRASWPEDTVLLGLSRQDFDVVDQGAVTAIVSEWEPDLVVNAAAYTAVDGAEADPDKANAVNAVGVDNLCQAAASIGARVLHLSTDYVFDGTKQGWYSELDEPSPLGAYGRSKRAGELAALCYPRNLVVRTSWVYSAHRSNFVLTMRRLAQTGGPIQVVADQRGCPTSAKDLSRALVAAVSQGLTWPGLFHLAAPDDATWFELATEAIEQMSPGLLAASVDPVEIKPITSAEYPTAAARPLNSRLTSATFNEAYGIALLPWRKALGSVTAELDATVRSHRLESDPQAKSETVR